MKAAVYNQQKDLQQRPFWKMQDVKKLTKQHTENKVRAWIEHATLGSAIPCSTTELSHLVMKIQIVATETVNGNNITYFLSISSQTSNENQEKMQR